ncbi:hypothetical protein [Dokdonia sp. Hel_I_53]|uniref:hypothetical protein n=1 Tax=Dokdonia sp. Hel_I_53 TaxID=1566287 RepID=UPI00119A3C1E|nr:hypothetical protein [Dokdonia sp. Hel_I_53]TVZ51418.1 hypothetical protein OD90_0559 [Dokdonia sp. Hel_I_53]
MYKTFFENIAATYGGKFLYKDKDISIGGGIRLPKVQYILKIPLENTEILISNITGKEFSARLSMNIDLPSQVPNFELSTDSHFKSLFKKKSDRFKIKSESDALTEFLENNIHIKELEKIAEDDAFEPYITGEFKDSSYQVEAEYHLEFDNWNSPVIPFIKLFKDLHVHLEHLSKSKNNALKHS